MHSDSEQRSPGGRGRVSWHHASVELWPLEGHHVQITSRDTETPSTAGALARTRCLPSLTPCPRRHARCQGESPVTPRKEAVAEKAEPR